MPQHFVKGVNKLKIKILSYRQNFNSCAYLFQVKAKNFPIV